jgi:hypothetical protein
MRVRDVMTYGAIGVSEETTLAEGLEVIAENTPGVVAVHNHMRWIEPAFTCHRRRTIRLRHEQSGLSFRQRRWNRV